MIVYTIIISGFLLHIVKLEALGVASKMMMVANAISTL